MRRALLSSSVLLLLVACNSGGSSSDAAPSVQVSAVNALAITGIVLDAAMGVATAGDTSGGILTTTVEGSGAARSEVNVRGLLARRLADLWTPRVLPVLVNGSETGPGGGTATYLWDDRDDNERLSSGDTFEIVFDDYIDEVGTTIAGFVGIDRLQVAGDPAVHTTWSIAGRMALGNLTVTANGSTTTLAGSIDCGIERRPTVAYQRLAVVTPLSTEVTDLLPGSVVEYAEYDAEYTFRIASVGSVSGAGLGGVVSYETKTALGGYIGVPNPSRGVIEVRGRGPAVLTITIVDSVTVQVDIDLDGDGEVDETQTTDWTNL
ncbi:MAG: hypothetical protein H6838_01185 [Planctomycetes bacterium]|nr:hypothetical protein [Planctomycetota bacterium]